MRLVLALSILAGCGRVEFEPLAADATRPPDAPGAPDVVVIGRGDVNSPTPSFSAWLRSASRSVVLVDDAVTAVDAAVLAGHQVALVLQLQGTHTAAEATAVADWIAAGGSLVALTAYFNTTTERSRINGLLAGTGLGFASPGTLLGGPVTTFVAHPTTTGLTSVAFMGGDPVDVSAGPPSTLAVATIGTSPVGVVCTIGLGRLYLWGDEWVTEETSWQAGPELQQFWLDALDWLTHRT